MSENRKMFVSPGLKPVHSFDLWGVLLDQQVLGERKIELYRETAGREKQSKDEIEGVVRDYRDLLAGKPRATGSKRIDIIYALGGGELDEQIRQDYALAFMQDALVVMRQIIEAGEGVLIFTSKPAPGLREQLASRLGKNIGEVRWGNKGNPATFRSVYDLEKKLGNQLVSHTADELPELLAARKSRLFPSQGLIYVNRNESNSEDEVRKAGIDRYINDLRDVEYTALVSSGL